MPRVSMKLYLGIDPGVSGGFALIRWTGILAGVTPMPKTETDVWDWIRGAASWMDVDTKGNIIGSSSIFAVIEQQTARPTSWFDKSTGAWRSSVLASTCELYGNYMQLKGFMIAASIPFEECPPKRWQKALCISPRAKGEKDTSWKNRLKEKAQQLFPSVKVTLAIADSLLIAEYCRRKTEGNL